MGADEIHCTFIIPLKHATIQGGGTETMRWGRYSTPSSTGWAPLPTVVQDRGEGLSPDTIGYEITGGVTICREGPIRSLLRPAGRPPPL